MESIPHLLLTCNMAKILWTIIAQALEQAMFIESYTKLGNGVISSFQENINFMIWALHHFDGPFGINQACFEGKIVKTHVEIVCYACSLMCYCLIG